MPSASCPVDADSAGSDTQEAALPGRWVHASSARYLLLRHSVVIVCQLVRGRMRGGREACKC